MNKKGIGIHIIGYHCSGKKTLCEELIKALNDITKQKITFIDEDTRIKLAKGLTHTKEDRSIQIKRTGYLCSEIVKHGGIFLFYSNYPYIEERKYIRDLISSQGEYFEIYLDTSLSICKERDTRGIYNLAEVNKINYIPGIDIDYEDLESCDLILNETLNLSENVKLILKKINLES